MKYVDEFFSMKCSGDIVNACSPINNAAKEISEAMAIRRRVKNLALADKGKYDVLDLCAGNALGSIMCAFSLPVRMCTAVDITPRHRPGHAEIDRFKYLKADIKKDSMEAFCWHPTILIAIHACCELSEAIIKIYNTDAMIQHMFLMPCCNSALTSNVLQQKYSGLGISKYESWALHLAMMCDGRIVKDENILSPKNLIICAAK